MRTYEVTFIVDPVLSSEEIKTTAQNYIDHLKSENCEIVNLQEIGLRQLAYPINKRSTGVYYSLEFLSETGEIVKKIELALKRDERVIRYLVVKLDKFGIQYNDDKRNGRIGKTIPRDEVIDQSTREEKPREAKPREEKPREEKPRQVAQPVAALSEEE